MTDVRPFRALRYDPARAPLSEVLAPVYDVVAPEDRARHWDRHPKNAVRLELTRDAADEAVTDYADVAERIAVWRREGVLVQEREPRFWVLRQRFEAPDGRWLARTGFFGALRLEDYAARVVRPHERTLAGPKADRLKLLRATRANLSAVFLLYEDRRAALGEVLEKALAADAAPLVGRDTAGVENTLVPVHDAAAAEAIEGFLAGRPCVIADGHHRYETALAYRDEQRAAGAPADGGSERLLAYFANAWAPGSLLLPIHRLVVEGPAPADVPWQRLAEAGWERSEIAVGDAETIPDALAEHLAPLSGGRHAFAADDGSGRLLLFQRPAAAEGELSVRVIHREVLAGVLGLGDEAIRQGAVAFPKSALQTARDVRKGRGTLAIYLNPLRPDDVFRVTEAGEVLPQKSTYFAPKLPTGLIFRLLDADA